MRTKQRLFIEEYLRCWNASEAARRAGYSPRTARSIGCENLTKPDIQAAIRERLEALRFTTDEVLIRLAQQARGEWTRYLRGDGTVDLAGLIADGYAHLVKALRWDRDGRLVLEFYDAQAALIALGKANGALSERVQVESEGLSRYLALRERYERARLGDGAGQ